jgi:hypothetical protein
MSLDDATATRVVEALEEYQRLSLDTLDENRSDPEACVRALVRLHLDWTGRDPDLARLVSRHRNAVMAGPGGERLTASNRRWFSEMNAWIDEQARTGRMEPVSFNLMHAVVFAPTQEIAKLWLAGLLKKPLGSYSPALEDAAWAAMSALPSRARD